MDHKREDLTHPTSNGHGSVVDNNNIMHMINNKSTVDNDLHGFSKAFDKVVEWCYLA